MLQKTIGQILPEARDKFPDKAFLVFGDRTFTFAEMDALTNRLADGLKQIGIEKGDRVTLYAQNGWEWVASYYAIAKAGGVINPINVMLTPDEVAFVVKDCGAKALFTTADRAQPILGLKQDGPLNEIVTFGGQIDAAAMFEAVVDTGKDDLAPVEVGAEDLSTICYTSGTTGFPKGAMLSHRNVILNAAITAAMNMRTEHDIHFTALPCAHVYGAAIMNLCALFGSTVVLDEKFDAGDALAAIERYRVTIVDGVPTMYMYMLAHPKFDGFDLSALTRCVVGGQTMPAAKSEEWSRGSAARCRSCGA